MADMEVPENIVTPKGIELRASAVDPGVTGTWATAQISKGTVFGPFVGEIVTEYDEKSCDYRFAWEVFDLDTKELLHVINATDATKGNWMRYMNCARYLEEQNFVSVQDNEKIYYKAIKDIKQGEELLIWYEPFKKRRKKRKKSVSSTMSSTPVKSPNKDTPLKSPKKTTPIKSSKKDTPLKSPKKGIPLAEIESLSQQSNSEDFNSVYGDAESSEITEDCPERSKRLRKKKKLFDEQYLMTDLIFKKKRKRRTKEEMEKAKLEEVKVTLEPGRKRRKRRRRNSKGELVDPSLTAPSEVKETEPVHSFKRQNSFVEEFNPEEISALEQEWSYPGRHLEYVFEPSAHFGIYQNGRKVFKCDVCSGIYKHTFSLKRHYLRNHINCNYLSKTDIANCLIQIGQQVLAMRKANSSEVLERVTKSLEMPLPGSSASSSPTLPSDESVESKTDTVIHEKGSADKMDKECQENKEKKETSVNKDSDGSKSITENETGDGSDCCSKDEKIKKIDDKESVMENLPIKVYKNRYIGKRFGLYKCSICFKLFDELDVLKSHTKDHPSSDDEKGFACDKCQMQFPYKQNLVRHQLVHDQEDKSPVLKGKKGEQELKKSSCSKSPDISGKPYKCQNCPMKFRFSKNLEKHKAIHLGNCPFMCTQCDKSFPTLTNLKKHQHFHTGKRVPCKHCPAIFLHVGSLRKHIRLEHPDIHRQRLLRLLEKRGKLSTKAAKALEENYVPERDDAYQAVPPKKRGRKKKKTIISTENQTEILDSKFSYPCVVCKKRFPSYVNMCRHRRLAHPSVTNDKKLVPPVPKSVPVEKEVVKPKPSRLKLLTEPFIKKEEKEIIFETSSDPIDNSPETTAAFYANVANNIAENLSNYLDGGETALYSCKTYIRNDSIPDTTESVEENKDEDLVWERYNFPLNYDPIVLHYNFIDLEEQQARMVKDESNEVRGVFDDGIPYVDKAPALCTRRRSSLEGISSTESSRDGIELPSPRKKENQFDRNDSKAPGGLLAKVCENLAKRMKGSPEKDSVKTSDCLEKNTDKSKLNPCMDKKGNSLPNPADTDNTNGFSKSIDSSNNEKCITRKNDLSLVTEDLKVLEATTNAEESHTVADSKEQEEDNGSSGISVLKLPLLFSKSNISSGPKAEKQGKESTSCSWESVDKQGIDTSADNCISLGESKMEEVTTVLGEDCLKLLENIETINNDQNSLDSNDSTLNVSAKNMVQAEATGDEGKDSKSPLHEQTEVVYADFNNSISSPKSNENSKKISDSEDDSECEIEFYDITSVMEASMAKAGYDSSPEDTNDQNSEDGEKDMEKNVSPDQTSGIGSKEEEEGEEDDDMSGYSSEGVYNPPLSDSDSDFDEHLNPGIPVGLLIHQLCLANNPKDIKKVRNPMSILNGPDAEKIYRNLLNNKNLRVKKSPNYDPYDNYDAISFGKHGAVAYVCSVCRRNFSDFDSLIRHQWKKHPSVACSYMQIEQGHDIEYLFYSEPSNVGLLGASGRALERISERTAFTCTRCNGSFKNVDRLRVHIINCAPDAIPSPSKSPKKKRHRKFPRKFMDSEHDLTGSPAFSENFKTLDKHSVNIDHKIKVKKNIFDIDIKKKPETPPPVIEEESTGKVRRKRSSDIGYNPSNHVRRREMTELLDRHQCRGCGVKFKSISLLERHVRKCDEKEKFKDLKVMKSTVNESFHKKQKQLCFYCSKEFAYPKILMNHFKAFCNVKKEKETTGTLTQEEREKESEIIKILKQQDQDRNEIVPHDLEREDKGPKKGWPKGLKRKSRRKTHSWTSVKKKKVEDSNGDKEDSGESQGSTSSENGTTEPTEFSSSLGTKNAQLNNHLEKSTVQTEVRKKKKVSIMQGLHNKKKELAQGEAVFPKLSTTPKTKTVFNDTCFQKSPAISNCATKCGPDRENPLQSKKTSPQKLLQVKQQKLLKLNSVPKLNQMPPNVGPPEIMTVAKAVSVTNSGKKLIKESSNPKEGKTLVLKQPQLKARAKNSPKIQTDNFVSSQNDASLRPSIKVENEGKKDAQSPKVKEATPKNKSHKKDENQKIISQNKTKKTPEKSISYNASAGEDKGNCNKDIQSIAKKKGNNKTTNVVKKTKTHALEKEHSGLQALLEVAQLEGLKDESPSMEDSGDKNTKCSKPAVSFDSCTKGGNVKRKDKHKNVPFKSGPENIKCVQGVCNVPNSVFDPEDVRDGLAPVNNLLQLAQVAADVLQGVVSKVEENNAMMYSTISTGIVKPEETLKHSRSLNNSMMTDQQFGSDP